MPCKFCARLRARQWAHSDAWEQAYSNDGGFVPEESVQNWLLVERAEATCETDPAASFRLFSEAAEEGSAWALNAVALHYWTGSDVAADLDKAREYYCRAICAGSWMATLYHARLLAEQGHYDECFSQLEEGVAADFVPAYFWLARLRYDRSESREVCREIRPMLEYAAGKGHPQAQLFLAQLKIWGKFGLGEIPAGLVSVVRLAVRASRNAVEDIADQQTGQ